MRRTIEGLAAVLLASFLLGAAPSHGAVTVTNSPASVDESSTTLFSLSVTHEGPAADSVCTVRLTANAAFAGISAVNVPAGWTSSVVGQVITWTADPGNCLKAIVDDVTQIFPWQGTAPSVGGSYSHAWQTTGGAGSGNVSTLVNEPVFTASTKGASDLNGAPLRPGETVRYSLTIRNTGNMTATNVSVADTLQAVFVGVAGVTGGGVVDPGPPIVITWNLGSMNPGATVALQFDATLDAPLDNNTVVSNRAVVRSDQTAPFYTPPANLSVTSAPSFAASTKSWTDLNGGLLQPGDTLSYSMVVPNTGDMHATGVNLTDALPAAGIDYVTGSTTLNGAGVADQAGVSPVVAGLLINSPGEPAGRINVGESASVTVRMKIRSDVNPGTAFNNMFNLTSAQGVSGSAAAPPATVLGAAHGLAAQLPATASSCDELEYVLTFTASTSVAFDTWFESLLASGLDYIPGSAEVTNSGQAGVNTDDPEIAGSLLRFNYAGAPNPGDGPIWDVDPGEALTIRFRLRVTFCAPGQYSVTSSANYRPGLSAPYTLLTPAAESRATVLQGALVITDTPVAPPAAVNDIIFYTIRVKSVGFGAVGNVEVSDSLRTGLRLVPSQTVPAPTSWVLNPDSTTSIRWDPTVGSLARLDPGEEQVITLAVRLVSCTDYDNIATATWGCEAIPCQTKTATASVNLLLNEPQISFALNPSPIPVPACDAGGVPVTFTVTNAGGEARDMDLFMSGFPAGLVIEDVSGAAYIPGSPATFELGTLLENEVRDITFRVVHIDDCASSSGTLVFTTRYTNLCGDPYTFTALIGSVSTQSLPGLTLSKSGPVEILAGTTDTWTISVCFAPGAPADTVWVDDSYPAGFSFVGDEDPPAFTGGDPGSTATRWFFLPADFAGDGCVEITYSLLATGACGTEGTNAATASTSVPCGAVLCGSSGSGSALTAIDCPDNTTSCVTTMLHTVNGAQGATEEVCVPMTHEVTIQFPPNPEPGFDFTDLVFKAQARHGKTLVGVRQLDGTWAYGKARFAFTDSLGQSCALDLEPVRDGNNELSWDLAPLDDLDRVPGCGIAAPPELAGGTLVITYDLVSDAAIAYHYEFARLLIDGGPGFACNSSVEEPVQVTVTRSTMGVGIGIATTAERCVAVAVPIDVAKSGAYGSYDNVLYLSTEGWEYIDDPSDPGFFLPVFSGGLPNVGMPTRVSDVGNGSPGVMWLLGDLPAGFNSGSVLVPLRKRCADLPAYTRLVYDDRCGNDDTNNIDQNSLEATASASPALVLSADVTLKLTPLTYFVTEDTAEWTLYCINGGAGAVENLDITSSTPGAGIAFTQVELLDQNGVPRPDELRVTFGSNNRSVNYVVDRIPAGETWRARIRAEATGCDQLTHDVSGFWGCGGDTCQAGPQLTQRGAVDFPPAVVIADIVGDVNIASCGVTSVTTEVKNASLVRVREGVYHLQLPSGVTYVDNSTMISIDHLGGATEPDVTAPSGNAADPVVSGQELIWVLEHYLSTEFLSPEDVVTIACQLRADPAFAGGVLDAVGTYADECGRPAFMTADQVPVTTTPFDAAALTVDTAFDSLQACTVAGADDNLLVLTVENPTGNGTAYGVMIVTATLPEGMVYSDFSTNITYPTAGGTGAHTTNPSISGTGAPGNPQRLRWTLPSTVQMDGGDDLVVRFRILHTGDTGCLGLPDGLVLTIEGERCPPGVPDGDSFSLDLDPIPLALRRPDLQLEILALDRTPNGGTVPGDTIQAIAVVRNMGAGWSRERTLRMQIDPAQLTFLSSTPAADGAGGGLYTWSASLPDLSPDAIDSVHVFTRVAQNVPLGAIIAVDGDLTDDCCGDEDEDRTYLTVNGAAHLDIEKFSTDAVIVPGGTVTYEIFVQNDGGQTLQNVVITETPNLPGLTYNRSQFDSLKVAFTGTAAAPRWTIARTASNQPKFQPGATEIIRLSYNISTNHNQIGTPAGIGYVYNRASITSVENALGNSLTGSDVLDSDGERVPVSVQGAGLDIQKVAVQGLIEPGELVTFLLRVTNIGGQNLTNVVVTDPIPPGLTLLTTQYDTATTVVTSLSPPTFTIASLPIRNQQQIALTFRASINAGDLGANVVNTASATGRDQGNGVVNATPSQISVPVQLRETSLDIDKVATTGTAEPGGAVTYTLSAMNGGLVGLTNVVVVDTPPVGLTYAGAQFGAGVSLTSTAPPTFTIASLPAGSLEQIAITFDVDEDPNAVPDPVVNTATGSGVDPSGNPVTADPAESRIPRGTPAPALDVAKIALDPALVPGLPVSYMITAQNTGNVPLSDVLITDPSPSGLTYRSSSYDGDVSLVTSSPPTYRIADLPVGAVEVFSIIFDTPVDPGALDDPTVNIVGAQGTAPGGAVIPAVPDTALVAVEPAPAGLDLDKVATTGVVEPGGAVTWQLHVRNIGSVDLSDVVVIDTPPAGLTFVSAQYGSGVTQTSVAPPTFQIATLPAYVGEIIALTFDVSADTGSLTDPVINRASASGTTPGGDTVSVGPIQNALPLAVPGNGLNVRKVATESFAFPGGSLTYLLTVTNTGEQELTDVDLVDIPPTGLTYEYSQYNAATVTQTGTAPPSWRIATLAPHAFELISVTFTTPENPNDMTDPVVNRAAGSGLDPSGGTVEADTTFSSVPRLSGEPRLDIEKSALTLPITAGSEASWLLTLINTGGTALSSISVTDILAEGLSYLTADPPAVEAPAGTLTWTLADLEPGQHRQIVLTTWVSPLAGPNITNTAGVTGTAPGGSVVTDSDAATAPVRLADSAIQIEKTPTTGFLVLGGQVTYILTLSNEGAQPLSGVSVTDPLPQGTVFASSDLDAARWSLVTTEPVTRWDLIGLLNPGESEQITLSLNGAADLAEYGLAAGDTTLVNTARVTAIDPQAASVEDLDEARVNINVPRGAVLLNKTATVGEVVPGQQVTYLLTVENVGDQDLFPLEVREPDLADQGLTFVASDFDSVTFSLTESPTGLIWSSRAAYLPGSREQIRITYRATTNLDSLANPIINAATAVGDDESGQVVIDSDSEGLPLKVLTAGLSVNKSAAQGQVTPGELATWTVTVANTGELPLHDVRLQETDLAPQGMEFFEARFDSTVWQMADSLTWVSRDTIAVGGIEILRITYRASADPIDLPLRVVNSVRLDGTDLYGRAWADSADESLPVLVPGASVDLQKEATAAALLPGQLVTWLLTLTNNGRQDLLSATVTDTLPPGCSAPVSDHDAAKLSFSVNGAVVEWTLNTPLLPGESETIRLTAETSANAADLLGPTVNRAVVRAVAANGDPLIASDSATLTLQLPFAALSVAKIPAQNVVTPGDPHLYTLLVENRGDTPLHDVELIESPPAGLQYESSEFDSVRVLWAGAVDAPRWSIPSLPVGAQVVIQVHFRAAADPLLIANPAVNRVTVAGLDPSGRQTAGEAESALPVRLRDARIRVEKIALEPVVTPAARMSWEIRVTNVGADSLFDVVVVDELPAGFADPVSTHDPARAQFSMAPKPTWTLTGPLAPGDLFGARLTAVASSNEADLADPVENSARASATNRAGASVADLASESVPLVESRPAVNIQKSTTMPVVTAGRPIAYTITVTNTGDRDLFDLLVRDVVPSGLSFASSYFDAVHVSFSGTPSNPAWSIARLPRGELETITVRFDAEANEAAIPDPVVNVASVRGHDASGTEVEDSDDESTPLQAGAPALHIDKVATTGALMPGGEVTYLLTVLNAGAEVLTDIRVEDPTPTELAYRASQFDAVHVLQTTAGDVPSWFIPRLPVGGFEQIRVTFGVDPDLAAPRTVLNTASAVGIDGRGGAVADADDESLPVAEPRPALHIDKSATQGSIVPGEEVTYLLTVTNNGDAPLRQLIVEDRPDSSLIYLTSNFDNRNVAIVSTIDPVRWSIARLEPGGIEQIRVTWRAGLNLATAGAPESIVNWAGVQGSTIEGTLASDDDEELLPVRRQPASIQILKWTDFTGRDAYADREVAYHLFVVNTGPQRLTDVTATDYLPPALAFREADLTPATVGDPGENDGGHAIWNIGALDPQEAWEVLVVTRIRSALPTDTVLMNRAVAAGTDPAGILVRDEDSVRVQIRVPHVAVDKSVDRAQARPGEAVTYRVTWRNLGGIDARAVVVVDEIPEGTTYVGGSATGGAVYQPEERRLVADVGTLPPDGVGSFTYQVRLSESLRPRNRVPNVATIYAQDLAPELSDTVWVGVSDEPLSLRKSVDLSVASAGDTLAYTIVWSVAGSAVVGDVVVEDVVPGLTQYVPGSSIPPAEYDPVLQRLSWRLGRLAAGSVGTLTYRLAIDPAAEAGRVILNDASIRAAGIAPIESNEVLTVLVPPARLAIEKQVDRTVAEPGDTLTFSLIVENREDRPVRDIVLTDVLPPEVIYLDGSAEGAAFDGTRLQWSLGTLLPGDRRIIHFRATVRDGVASGTQIMNLAQAVGADAVAVESNVVLTLVLYTQIDLVKTANQAEASAGTKVTYTVTARNSGNARAADLILHDARPGGFEYVAGSSRIMRGDAIVPLEPIQIDPLRWAVGTLDQGEEIRLSYDLLVGSGAAEGSQRNCVTAAGTGLSGDTLRAGPACADLNVVAPHLVVTKTTPERTVEPGELVLYTVTLRNPSRSDLRAVMLVDRPPMGFQIVRRTARLDGNRLADPEGDGPYLWSIGDLPAGASRTLEYDMIVGLNAPTGVAPNIAEAEGLDALGASVRAGPVDARVTVLHPQRPAAVQGWVFIDCDEDGQPDSANVVRSGVPGIELLLEDGRRVHTDDQGGYFIYPLERGDHLIRLDRNRLSSGARVVGPSDRFFYAVAGGRARVNFRICLDEKEGILRFAKSVSTDRVSRRTGTGEPERFTLGGFLFDTARATLRPGADLVLREVAERLKTLPDATGRVEGHTDIRPIQTAQFPDNYALSVARAESVRQALIQRFGIAASRLSARGFGPDRPVADGYSEEDWQRNRRVEILIDDPSGGEPGTGGYDPEEVEYRLTLVYAGEVPLAGLIVEDRMPDGLAFIPGSSREDGQPASDPEIEQAGGTTLLRWTLGDADGGFQRVIAYRARVESLTDDEGLTNEASVRWIGGSGEAEATAAVGATIRLGAETDSRTVRYTLDGVLFDTGRANLRPEADAVLRRVLEAVRGLETPRLIVEGHTDDRPIRWAEFRDNQALSEARARTVADWLAREAGLDPSSIEVRGFGPTRPAATNATPEGRQANRRVEVEATGRSVKELIRPSGEPTTRGRRPSETESRVRSKAPERAGEAGK